MNRADIRVIQGGRGSGLASETVQGLRVASEFVRQKLEGQAAQACVLSLVNHAHSAAAQLIDNAVMGNGPADREIAAFPRVFSLLVSEGPSGPFIPRQLSRNLCRGGNRDSLM